MATHREQLRSLNRYSREREIRTALADYMYSEGCSCCRNQEKHDEAEARLAKMLRVPKFKDGSGYDFYKFKTKK